MSMDPCDRSEAAFLTVTGLHRLKHKAVLIAENLQPSTRFSPPSRNELQAFSLMESAIYAKPLAALCYV